MAEKRVQRRLAAILAADMVGYSRLMGEDEMGTLTALKHLRAAVIDPAVAEHRGRIVKLMGDGALVEFASVVDAVECAVRIQREMAERYANPSESQRIAFRIGVNLGDIIIDGDDTYGDGVNVAARLEGLAEPGGICISAKVYEEICNKLDLGFADLGERQLKNIEKPVRAYRLLIEPVAAGKIVTVSRESASGWIMSAVAVALVVIVGAGGFAWWQAGVGKVELAPVERMAFPLPDKPSIAVLPFQNMSADPNQDYFADGMAEDIITDLSKLSALFVIARNSSFKYKGRTVDVKQVGRELGVRYVLEGSVRRAGEQVRINAQLVDAETGGHLWAERYDGRLVDMFALQDKVTGRIIEALSLTLKAEETAQLADHGTTNVEAHDAFLKGLAFARQYTAEGATQAIEHYKRALELDPNYSRASAALAQILYTVWQNYWSQAAARAGYATGGLTGVDEAMRVAKGYAQKALEHPTPSAHIAQALVLRPSRHYDEAIDHAQAAITLDPNDAEGYLGLAELLVFAGEPERAIAHFENARRLDPHNVERIEQGMGLAFFGMERFDIAARHLETARNTAPNSYLNWLYLAATYAYLGREEEAKSAAKRMNELRREQRIGRSFVFSTEMLFLWYFKEKNDEDRLRQGLIKAGVSQAKVF